MANELGLRGEQLAEAYLRAKGYRIRERNWRHGRGEIDIIALDGSETVFVEVKTRSSDRFGRPERALHRHKRAVIVRTASHYLACSGNTDGCRFDLAAIVLDREKVRIRHFMDVFWPGVFE